eukprot:TRINITY_DN58291_c0_g1_i1.p1 TRINITY_DN58291_c0_g1~~TRINITY_DN58291_c0_g1_i1.p1  ORF type:complete len:421 (-),score=46.13 TRINITY_DN58291_c0_g1_i1:141-1325(-)
MSNTCFGGRGLLQLFKGRGVVVSPAKATAADEVGARASVGGHTVRPCGATDTLVNGSATQGPDSRANVGGCCRCHRGVRSSGRSCDHDITPTCSGCFAWCGSFFHGRGTQATRLDAALASFDAGIFGPAATANAIGGTSGLREGDAAEAILSELRALRRQVSSMEQRLAAREPSDSRAAADPWVHELDEFRSLRSSTGPLEMPQLPPSGEFWDYPLSRAQKLTRLAQLFDRENRALRWQLKTARGLVPGTSPHFGCHLQGGQEDSLAWETALRTHPSPENSPARTFGFVDTPGAADGNFDMECPLRTSASADYSGVADSDCDLERPPSSGYSMIGVVNGAGNSAVTTPAPTVSWRASGASATGRRISGASMTELRISGASAMTTSSWTAGLSSQ